MTTNLMERTDKSIEFRPKNEVAGAETTRPGSSFTPAVDIFETADAISMLVDMPGVGADGMSVDLRDGVLTIEGRIEEAETREERVLSREYEIGSFRSVFQLTELIDHDAIRASIRNGVLRLTLPKSSSARPRRIDVQAG